MFETIFFVHPPLNTQIMTACDKTFLIWSDYSIALGGILIDLW